MKTLTLLILLFSTAAYASPPPVYEAPKIKEIPYKPFLKPEGNFENPQHFKTEKEATDHCKLAHCKVDKDYLLGGWVTTFGRIK